MRGSGGEDWLLEALPRGEAGEEWGGGSLGLSELSPAECE